MQCVAGTPGAALHPQLAHVPVDAHFAKGRFAAAYSGFEARKLDPSADKADESGELLGDWLKANGITSVVVVGLAADHCVKATAFDAVEAGFTTTIARFRTFEEQGNVPGLDLWRLAPSALLFAGGTWNVGPGQLFGEVVLSWAALDDQSFRLQAGGLALEVGYRFEVLRGRR